MTSITYDNRNGVRYYLCAGKTKLGKIRYYFAREQGGTPVTAIPEGHEIRESINGMVSLARTAPVLILAAETDAIKAELEKHPKGHRYRVEAQSDRITVYEGERPDPEQLQALLAARLGIRVSRLGEASAEVKVRYAPMLRFLLADQGTRTFMAQRMCFRSPMEGWLPVSAPGRLSKLAKKLVPTLGTDAFYELF